MSWKAAHLSIHGDPLAPLGGIHHGGQNVYVKELTRHLGALGLEVDVFSRWESEETPDKEIISRNARVVRVPVGPAEAIAKEKTIRYLSAIASWINSYQEKQSAPYQLVHSHYYFSGAVGVHLKNQWKVPLVHNNHSLGAVKEQALGSRDTSPDIREEIERKIFQAADRVIATAPHEKTELVEIYQADPGRITVIPPGVNLDLFAPQDPQQAKSSIGYSPGDFLVTYVGRIEKRKGIDTLLKAVHQADEERLQLVIVGGPPSSKAFLSWTDLGEEPYLPYRDLLEEYNLEGQVTFTGGKPQSELSTYYSAGDVTVIPSYYEPFGLTALEAMACGGCVIGSRVGGLAHTIKEGQVGMLFEPRDAGQLADKILELKEKPNLNLDFRKNARGYVEENYSWRNVTKQIAGVYQEVIEPGA
ncbi:MAG: glycosyltransferase [Anaerolineales bacterium]|nr:glycosyltransferase [Anaerolineales bacterium]